MKKTEQETGPVEDMGCMRRRSVRLLVIATFILIAIFATSATALPVFDKIGGALGSYASNDTPGLFDLFIFTVIFFALCWIGFGAVFKDAKNANVVLSLALGIALSIALVYGGKVGLVKLLPFAGLIIFIIVFVLVYALLNKFIFKNGGAISKVLSAVVAIILTIALVMVAWNTICDMGACESNGFMQKLTGTGSIFGKIMYKIDNIFDGAPIPSPPPAGSPNRPDAVAKATQYCGNGKIDKSVGEICDPRASPNGCKEGWFEFDQKCNMCTLCEDQSTAGAIYDSTIGNWYIWLPVMLVVWLLVWKRQDIKDRYARRKLRKMHKKGLKALEETLKTIEADEKSIQSSFRDLCEAVKNEKTTFQESRHIVDEITTDIKETIGQEREFIKNAYSDKGGNISKRVNQLIGFNNREKSLITGAEGILPKINEQFRKLNEVPDELQEDIRSLQGALAHFEEHNRILETFKQHDFKEKDILTGMLEKLKSNKEEFAKLDATCSRMIDMLNIMQTEIGRIAKSSDIDYATIRRYIRDIRDNAIKLNKAFSEKVALIHQMMHRLQEIRSEILKVHEDEKTRALMFCDEARHSYEKERFDSAIYLACHVVEIVDNLKTSAFKKEEIDALDERAREALRIISDSLPKLFESMSEEIQTELDKGEFKKVMDLTEHIGEIEFIRDELNDKFNSVRKEYSGKIADLKQLCEKMEASSKKRVKLLEELGTAPEVPEPGKK